LSGEVWQAKVSDDVDRWTVTVPATTRQRRALDSYVLEKGAEPPTGWHAPALPAYVTVAATLSSNKIRRTVLRTKEAAGSEEEGVTISSIPFGRNVTTVTLTSGTRTGFRRARLRGRPAARIKLIAVVLGLVSGAVVASFAIGDKMANPYSVTPTLALAMKIVAAVFAALSPVLAAFSDVWFGDADVPT
jgi:hypothetical protein